jgi:hypothetical protein
MADYGVAHLKALAERGLAFKRRHELLQAKAETSVMRAVGLLATAAGGLASGVGSGRFPTTTFVGMPPDLVVGGLFSVGAIFNVAGKASDALGNFGNGLVAGFMARFGAGLGTKLKNHQPLFSGTAMAGALPHAHGRPFGGGMGHAAAAAFERQVVNMPVG